MSKNLYFSGDFRQKPQQRFSGVIPKSLEREQLIQQAAHERKLREELRQHTQIATKLQSQFRKYLCQKRWYDSLRVDFDNKRSWLASKNVVQNDDIYFLGVRFVRLNRFDVDLERLFFLNQILCNYYHVIKDDMSRHMHWLKRMFELNVVSLVRLINHKHFELILYLFDLYLSPGDDNNGSMMAAYQIWNHLLSTGYMVHLQVLRDKIRAIGALDEHQLLDFDRVMLGQLLKMKPKTANATVQTLMVECLLRQLLPGFQDWKMLNQMLDEWCHNRPAALTNANVMNGWERMDHEAMPLLQYLTTVYSAIKLLMPGLISQSDHDGSRQMLSRYLALLKHFSNRIFSHFRAKPQDHSVCQQVYQKAYCFSTDSDDKDGNDGSDSESELSAYHYDLHEQQQEPQQQQHEQEERRKLPDNWQLGYLLIDIFGLLNTPEHCAMLVRFMDSGQEPLVEQQQRQVLQEQDALEALCQLGHLMLCFHENAIHHNRLLHSLAFKANFLKRLWHLAKNQCGLTDGTTSYLEMLARGSLRSDHPLWVNWPDYLPPMTMFFSIFHYFLQTLDDMEFFDEYRRTQNHSGPDQWMVSAATTTKNSDSILPFPLSQIITMSGTLRDVGIRLIEMSYTNRHERLNPMVVEQPPDLLATKCWSLLLQSLLRLLRHIYGRDTRWRFCPKQHWVSKQICINISATSFNVAMAQRHNLQREFGGPQLNATTDHSEEHGRGGGMGGGGSHALLKDVINVALIQELPFVVPFETRVTLMQALIDQEKLAQGANYTQQSSRITIRRNYLYEDSFDWFTSVPNMKACIRVQLISPLGLEETGVDGGGILREFLNDVLKEAMNPNRGLFLPTTDGCLYPNPSAPLLYEISNYHYYLIGRLLGKAIYERTLIELPFALFFLTKILRANSDIEINHLASLDPELYKNLISVKNHTGDVSELGLDFTIVQSNFGTRNLIELKPDGSKISVTNQNRIEYIHLVADYKLNKQIRDQCRAFQKGLYEVVDFSWLSMFDPHELQVLISGPQKPINLSDLMMHTTYSGRYEPNHPVIKLFWEVVSEFDESDKRKLLKFVTSTSQPPLLGFKELYPAFCIQNAGSNSGRLPTAATCLHLLKLPEITDKKMMREKLMYSINSGSGFELS